MSGVGIYVYGIVTADHPCRLSNLSGVGGTGAEVWPVAAAKTAAVASSAPDTPLGESRDVRDVLAHQRIVEQLWQQGPVLPMRFGTVAPDQACLLAELTRSESDHLAALAEVAGCAEVNVKLYPDEEQVVIRVATGNPALRRLARQRHTTYVDRIRLGEAVATAVRDHAVAEAEVVTRTLSALALRAAPGPSVADCALNTSFLIEQGDVGGFLSQVNRLEQSLGGCCKLRATGPIPPYSFTVASTKWFGPQGDRR